MHRIRSHPRVFMSSALLLILLGLLAVTAAGALAKPAEPTANFGMTWDVFANGGVTMSSPHYRMLSTAGQPLTAVSTSADLRLKSGYWYGLQDVLRRIFMPMLNRNH